MKLREPVISVSLNPAIDRVLEIDEFAVGKHQRGRTVSLTPAGKGVNTAKALAKLGVSAIATGFVGQEEFQWFEDELDCGGVRSQMLAVPGKSRQNIILINPASRQETHISDLGCPVAGTAIKRLNRKVGILAKEGSVVILAGALLPGFEEEDLLELIEICQHEQAQVAVDSSGIALRAMRGKPLWLMCLDREELGNLTGRPIRTDDQIIEAGREITDLCRCLIVRCDPGVGYVFVDGHALLGQVVVPPDRVQSTTSSGHCLLAGFVAAQLRGLPVRDSYRQGLAVAAASMVHSGPVDFTAAEVDEFLAMTTVEGMES